MPISAMMKAYNHAARSESDAKLGGLLLARRGPLASGRINLVLEHTMRLAIKSSVPYCRFLYT